jgi:hypothetical protein
LIIRFASRTGASSFRWRELLLWRRVSPGANAAPVDAQGDFFIH